MALNTLGYLNLSAIAYLDIDKLSIGKDIAQLIEDKVISEKDLNSSELSALQDPSSVSEVEFSIEINSRSISPLHRAYS